MAVNGAVCKIWRRFALDRASLSRIGCRLGVDRPPPHEHAAVGRLHKSKPTPYPANQHPIHCQPTPYPANRRPIRGWGWTAPLRTSTRPSAVDSASFGKIGRRLAADRASASRIERRFTVDKMSVGAGPAPFARARDRRPPALVRTLGPPRTAPGRTSPLFFLGLEILSHSLKLSPS